MSANPPDPTEGPEPSIRRSAISVASPDQDPSALTTEAVDRATRQWRLDLQSNREIIEARLDAMDKATTLRLEIIDALPGEIKEEIQHLREFILSQLKNVESVAEQRFIAVDTRFEERDDRIKQAAIDSAVSLGAALAAAKEAVSEQNKANTLAIGKSEAATAKQIDAIAALMSTSNKSLEDKISDIKTRFDRTEGAGQGKKDNTSSIYAVIGALGILISISITVITLIITK